jgi:hypothetical protein
MVVGVVPDGETKAAAPGGDTVKFISALQGP